MGFIIIFLCMNVLFYMSLNLIVFLNLFKRICVIGVIGGFYFWIRFGWMFCIIDSVFGVEYVVFC